MHTNSLRVLLLVLLCAVFAYGQERPAPSFRLFAEIGGGYAYKLNTPGTSFGTYTRDGMAGTFRLKWGWSTLFGIGMETGWIPISSTRAKNLNTEFGPIDISASASAVPLLAVCSMEQFGVQLHSGWGFYRVHAAATVMGESMESSEWKMGYQLSLGYGIPIASDHRVGMEVQWNNIVEHQVSILSLQARIIINLFGE